MCSVIAAMVVAHSACDGIVACEDMVGLPVIPAHKGVERVVKHVERRDRHG
jgi:hypothetical protein